MKEVSIELNEDEYTFLQIAAKQQKIKLEILVKNLLSQYVRMVTTAITSTPNDTQIREAFRKPPFTI